MLRASCEANNIQFDPGVIVDPENKCGIRFYRELIEFADALLGGETEQLNVARENLRSVLGDVGVIRASAVIGNFQMMNRALDTLGAQLGKEVSPEIQAMAKRLGMAVPGHWA